MRVAAGAVIVALLGFVFGVHHHHHPKPKRHGRVECRHRKDCKDKIVPSPYIPVAGGVPVSTGDPTISGTTTQGSTLTEAHGTWTNSPTSYTYQWEDCDSSGGSCTAITSGSSCSATLYTCAQTYVLQASDVGDTIRVKEIAHNASGPSGASTSNATAVVTSSSAPVNTALPTISGTTQQGRTLTEAHGTWTNSPTSYSYQWEDCNSSGASCVNISGATAQTYVLQAGDVGDTIRVVETATNGAGSTPATSTQTSVVTSSGVSVGTGASLAQCSGTCGVPTWSTTGTAISVPDSFQADAKTITQHIYYAVPTGLVTNDSSHPVPIVIIFPDSCTTDSPLKGSSCFTATNPDAGPTGWTQISATDKFIMVAIFADGQNGYYTPTVYGSPGNPGTCGTSGTDLCDQLAELKSVVTWAEGRWQIDTNRIFATGGSKGGGMTNDAVCDTHTESLFAGLGVGSSIMTANGGTNSSPPTIKGSCPALDTPGTLTPVTTAHPLMLNIFFSARDASYSGCTAQGVDGVSATTSPTNGYCSNGGGVNGAGNYVYAQDEQQTLIANPAFGCSNSTTTKTEGDGSVKVRTYGSCNANSANGVETQVIDYTAGCHAYGCNNSGGAATYVAQQLWNFWTTGTTTP